MKDEKKVTNFKETEENMNEAMEKESVIQVKLTPGEKLDLFLINHGPKIKAAAFGLLGLAAVGIGYLIVEGLKTEEPVEAGAIDGSQFDTIGDSVDDVIKRCTDEVTNF